MTHSTNGRKAYCLHIQTIVQTVALILLTVLTAYSQNPLAPAGKFNIFTQGNATLITNESEGAVAIGGNLTVGGNYQVAFSTSGSFTQPAFPNVKIGLVVGGGVALQSGNLKVLNNGFIEIGNCAGGAGLSSLRVWFRDQNNATSPIRITKSNEGYASPSSWIELNGNANTFYSSLADTASNPICQANVIDFATAFNTLKANSTTLTSCTGNVRTTNANGDPITNFSGQNLYLRDPVAGLPANATRVLNISGSDLNAVNNITLSFTPTASQPLVINVSTGTTFNWNVTNQNVSGAMKYIIWNFPNATTLNIQGNATIEGSVLAPNAVVTKTTNQSNIEGQLISQTFTVSGGEMHNYPFEGNVTCGTPVCNAPTPKAASQERCGPGTVTFTASGCTTGFTPTWYTSSALSTQAGSGTTFITPSLTTTTDYYLACVKDSDASCKSTGVKVTATVNPAVNVTIDGPTSVCTSNLPVTYTASPNGGTFTLPNGLPNGFATINGNVLTLNPGFNVSSLTFSYAVTGTNGCGGTASKSVTLNSGGTPVNLNPATICENQTLTFTDANGTNGTWSGLGITDTGTGATFNPAQAFSQAGQNAPASVYIFYTQTNGACSRKDSALITINHRPVVTIAGPETVCANELPATFTAMPAGGTFTLPNGLPAGFATTNGNVLTLNPGFNITSLSFSYSYTDPTTNCSTSATKSVAITPAPTISVNSPTICKGEMAMLTVSGCDGVIRWSTDPLTPAPNTLDVSPVETTDYTVTCSFSNGCESTAIATVTVNQSPYPKITLLGNQCNEEGTAFDILFSVPEGTLITSNKGTITGNKITGVPNGESTTITAQLGGCIATASTSTQCQPFGCGIYLDTLTETAATCDGFTVKDDASFTINRVLSADRYVYATSKALLSDYNSAISITSTSITVNNLPNPSSPMGQVYYIRIFNGSDSCSRDTSLLIPYRDCSVACTTPDAGDNVFLCGMGQVEVKLPSASPMQKWIAGANNPAGIINPGTGSVTNLNVDGIYTFILVDGAPGSTCADTVFVVRGSLTIPIQTTCSDTITLPTYINGTWTAAQGNPATVTAGGKVSGMNTPGNYTFNLTTGNCTTTLTVVRQDCGTPCFGITLVGSALDTLCSDYYGEPMSVKVGNNTLVKFVRFTSPQTSATVYSGGTLLDTVTPSDSIAGWPKGIPGSQFPGNSGTTPVTYYVYAIIADTSQLPANCRPFALKTYLVLPLPTFTQITAPVCIDSTTYRTTVSIPAAGTYRIVVARGVSSTGNGPAPQDIITEVSGVAGNGPGPSLSLTVADSNAVVIVYDQLTGCARALPVIKPTRISCAQRYDLALKKDVDKKLAMIGDAINYTLRVWNEGEATATGIEVTDPLNVGVQYVTHTTAQGNFNPATGIWTVGSLAPGDTAVLSIAVKVVAEGVWFNTAEISKMNEKDEDSTPGNGVESEDDIDRECFTVPIIVCRGQNASIELNVPAQYSNVVWFRKVQGGQPVQVGTGNAYTAQETELGSYEYTFTSSSGSCPAEGCCPILIAVQDCCPVEVCVPITIKRVRRTGQ